MRILIYTGKGGVGKTSVAAATAVRLAALGERTLVVSTDAAHSLGDALDVGLIGEDPVEVARLLWAIEIDSMREAEVQWGAMQRWFSGVLQWAKLDDVSSEELLVFPGLEELFALLRIREFADSGEFDVIVVDCAPTGETLRLLSYPDVLRWWLEKLFPFQKRVSKLARPVTRVVTGGLELPDDDAVADLERWGRNLVDLQQLLGDPETTSVRLVLNPEKMVLAESRRAFTHLNLFGFAVDAVIVNKVLPDEADDGYMATWRRIQDRYDEEIVAAFDPLPILRVPLMETEVVGLDMLDRLADRIYGRINPKERLYTHRVEEVRKEAGGYVLDLAVGFAAKDEINLVQRGDELTVQIGAYKRKALLSRTLVGRPVKGAKFEGRRLLIRFGERPAPGEAADGTAGEMASKEGV